MDFHDYPGASDGGSLEDFVTKHGIATDLALNFARAAFCARLPITERMLDEVIDFLNDKNREYAEGEADYNWSVWADNCVHTLRNALAAANIWSPLSVRAVKFLQLFNLAVPANEFVNLAELGNEGNIADYEQIQQDDPQRDALHEFNWLPTRHGALLKTLPVYEPNDLYDNHVSTVHASVAVQDGQDRACDQASVGRSLRQARREPSVFSGQIRRDPCET